MRSTLLSFVYAITSTCFVWKATANPLGGPCTTYNDCDGQLICTGGLCSELPSTQTCSWTGHGIGAACAADTDCSDQLVCDSNGLCADLNANGEPPFLVTFGCWDHTFSTTGPDCGRVHCPGGASETESVLEIQGENFNTGNVDIQVLSGSSVVYSGTVNTVTGNPGQLAGSFDLKTYVLCPSFQSVLEIQLTDGCTGSVMQLLYP